VGSTITFVVVVIFFVWFEALLYMLTEVWTAEHAILFAESTIGSMTWTFTGLLHYFSVFYKENVKLYKLQTFIYMYISFERE